MRVVVIMENKISYSEDDFVRMGPKGFRERIKERIEIEKRLSVGWKVKEIQIYKV